MDKDQGVYYIKSMTNFYSNYTGEIKFNKTIFRHEITKSIFSLSQQEHKSAVPGMFGTKQVQLNFPNITCVPTMEGHLICTSKVLVYLLKCNI